MDFNNKEKYIVLFEIYNKLLTEKQCKYFKLHFIEDYSLSEISQLNGISRNAVHDSISKIIKNLTNFENNLKLNHKNNLREEIYSKYIDKNYNELINELKKIDEID